MQLFGIRARHLSGAARSSQRATSARSGGARTSANEFDPLPNVATAKVNCGATSGRPSVHGAAGAKAPFCSIRLTSKRRPSTLALPGFSLPSTASSPIIKSISARSSECPDRPRSQLLSSSTRFTSIFSASEPQILAIRRDLAKRGESLRTTNLFQHPGRDWAARRGGLSSQRAHGLRLSAGRQRDRHADGTRPV